MVIHTSSRTILRLIVCPAGNCTMTNCSPPPALLDVSSLSASEDFERINMLDPVYLDSMLLSMVVYVYFCVCVSISCVAAVRMRPCRFGSLLELSPPCTTLAIRPSAVFLSPSCSLSPKPSCWIRI